jgi:glutaredoxin 2
MMAGPMLESLEIVKHINSIGEPILTGSERPEIAVWAERTAEKTAPLTWPRYPLLGLPEFATVAALDHYIIRKRRTLGDLSEHRAKTQEYLRELAPLLEELDVLIQGSQTVSGRLSLDDIRVLPLLRSAAVVKGLQFPRKVRDYFESMMSRISYQPLPAV